MKKICFHTLYLFCFAQIYNKCTIGSFPTNPAINKGCSTKQTVNQCVLS